MLRGGCEPKQVPGHLVWDPLHVHITFPRFDHVKVIAVVSLGDDVHACREPTLVHVSDELQPVQTP